MLKGKILSYKTALKATTVAGLAAVMLSTGIPSYVHNSFAEAVKIDAPQVASFANVVDAVSPAVVSVSVQSNVQDTANDDSNFSFNFGGRGFDELPDDHPLKRFFREFGGPDGERRGERFRRGPGGKHHLRPTAQGSGFFISEDGYLVTNNHVVSDGEAFTVVMNDGTELDAKLVGKDSRTDLAVLKVDAGNRKFTYVQFADDSKVRVGDWVVAVGNPFGLGGTVTAGIISARGRDIGSGPYDDYLQVDAAVNRGNSGGPTFNLNGEVVGINTAIFSPSGGNVGIAFAIPASVNKDIAESLGLSEASGALVTRPQEDSPGLKAGIQKGDVITAVNGETVKDPRDLARRIGAIAPGSKVEVSLWREGKAQSVTVELGSLPNDQKQASADDAQKPADDTTSAEKSLAALGLTVAPAEDGKGVTIVSVDPDSDAADKGLKQGEKITSVNNKEVTSADDVTKIINQAAKDGRKKALFQIETQNGNRFTALSIDQG